MHITFLSLNNSKTIRMLVILVISLIVFVTIFFIDDRMSTIYQWEDVQIDSDLLAKYEAKAESDGRLALVDEIYFNGEKLIYDYTSNTFYYSVIEDEEGYTPSISVPSISLKSAITHGKPKLLICPADANEIYDAKLVMSYRGKTSVSNLVFTTLPVMNINISADTVEKLGLDDTYGIEDYETVSMSLFDNSSDFSQAYRLVESAAKIHMRGGTTIGAPQKSYRLSLLENDEDQSTKKKVNLLNLREDDDWILFAAYSDYEKIRTVFSMNLWHDMATGNNEWKAANSNEYKYIELFINNHYHGLYALSYPIDKKQFKISRGESLFKKRDWSGTEFSLDLEPYDSGDYWLPGYSLEEGSFEDYEQLHQLYYEMAYSEDPETIRSTCDMDNAIDLWLFYKLTQAVDNVYTTNVKNLYSATKLSNTGIDGYKLLLCPWDMDQTFGNRFVDGQGSHGISSYFNEPDYDLPMEWSPVYFLMNCGDEQIVTQVKTRYDKLRKTVWSDDAISEAIASYEDDIYNSGAFVRTMDRWPDGNYYAPEIKLDDFEAYVLERLNCMDQYMTEFACP